jgi:thymidylate kinase
MPIFGKSPQRICPIVAIVGVDGCGKSTVIERLKSFKADFPKVKSVTIAHVGSKKQPGTPIVNHQLPPRSILITAVKLFERALRWRHKYYAEFLPQQASGILLLCDRFYFDDIIIDPLKYRYAGPPWLLEKVREMVPGPQLYVLLDLPEMVAYNRKPETAPEKITMQRENFTRLVGSHPNGFIVDANHPIEVVVENVRQILLAARDKHNSH